MAGNRSPLGSYGGNHLTLAGNITSTPPRATIAHGASVRRNPSILEKLGSYLCDSLKL